MALQFGLCTYNSSGYRIWRTSVKGPVLFRWQSSGGWSKVKDEVNLVRPVLGSMLWVPRMAFTLLTGWQEEHLTRENLCHSLIHIDSLPKQEEEKPRRPANTGSPRIKVKAFHTRYRALGPVLIPVYTGSQLAGHPPGSRLPLLTARLAVTSPAAEHHRPMAGTKLYCLVTEAHTCEQLAQGCYAALPRVGFELNSRPVDRKWSMHHVGIDLFMSALTPFCADFLGCLLCLPPSASLIVCHASVWTLRWIFQSCYPRSI